MNLIRENFSNKASKLGHRGKGIIKRSALDYPASANSYKEFSNLIEDGMTSLLKFSISISVGEMAWSNWDSLQKSAATTLGDDIRARWVDKIWNWTEIWQ